MIVDGDFLFEKLDTREAFEKEKKLDSKFNFKGYYKVRRTRIYGVRWRRDGILVRARDEEIIEANFLSIGNLRILNVPLPS